MHHVQVHIHHWKGDSSAETGEEGAILLSHYLVIDGEEVYGNADAPLRWRLTSTAPFGVLALELVDPPQEVRDRFPPEDCLESEDPLIVVLPLAAFGFVPYVKPPPVTEFERMMAEAAERTHSEP